MAITMELIKKLRQQTGARIMDCKKALEEAKGDLKLAEKYVQEKGLARAEKSTDREAGVGYIASYTHATGQIASLVELLCETDFVAANEEFRQLARNLAMQVAAMSPQDKEEFLQQDFIRASDQSVDMAIKALSGKIGEKIILGRFVRFVVGQDS
jgi:elongation factor Ts